MALVLPALTDCRWWFESLLVHSGVSSATRRKATGADKKKKHLVRQCCIHRSATLQELDEMLREYDMKRDSVEINHRAPQWSHNAHNAVWNRKYMEPKTGYTLRQPRADSEPAIGRKSSPSSNVKDSGIRRAVAAIANLPSSTLPDIGLRLFVPLESMELEGSDIFQANSCGCNQLS